MKSANSRMGSRVTKVSMFMAAVLLGSVSGAANPHAPTPQPAASPVAAGPAPSPVPPPPELLSPAIAKKLLPEFQRAQASELKALEHRHKLELKELKASQAARQKDWERQEKEARHRYFAEHTKGPDRRNYIKDFMERGRNFRQLLADERSQRTHEQDARLGSMKSDQAQRLKEFKEALGRNERPAARLWPGSN
jgi:hypothetical protein